MEQLILQGLGAGRDDHTLARQQRWHQIREGFAGAGAGFGDQGVAIGNRFFDGFSHRLLGFARGKVGDIAREGAVAAE